MKNFNVKKVHVYERYSESNDGYGGYNSTTWYELGYEKSKKRVELGYEHQRWSVKASHYYELTGRRLNIEEMKLIFKNNKDLFDDLEMTDNEYDIILRSVGKRTEALERKIKVKKKILGKHKKELQKMLNDYYGGKIPYWEGR